MLILNRVMLAGRIAQDLEPRYAQTGTCVVSFSIAVERQNFKKDAPKVTDFINCVAFGKTAETIANFMKKGSGIYVEGEFHIDSYTDKNGQKQKTPKVQVDRFKFNSDGRAQQQNNGAQQGFNANAFGGQQVSGDVEIDF